MIFGFRVFAFRSDTTGGRLARPAAFGARAPREAVCLQKRKEITEIVDQALSNEYVVEKIGLDTDENEALKV